MRYSCYNFWAILIFCLLTFCVTLDGVAQSDATLRVLVTSGEDGTPVVGANVLLLSHEKNEDGGYEIIDAGATDKDGFQQFQGISPGRYRLEISFIGYKTHHSSLTFERNDIEVKQISLSTNVEELEELIVESERKNETGEAGLTRISDVDLSQLPSPGSSGDLGSYLQTLPGVMSTGDRGGDLYIRGGTPAQNTVLVDNLPIIKPFHISNLFSAFSEKTVQNIDVYAGGFGAEYLGATSAILDVSLKPGNMKNYAGDASVAPYLMAMKVEGPIKKDKESFLFMGRKSIIDQTSSHLGVDDMPINFYDFTARYSYQSDNYYCSATGIHTYDNGQINPSRNLGLSWTNTVVGGRCRGFDERHNHPFVITAGYSSYQNSESSDEREERSSSYKQINVKMDYEEEVYEMPLHYGFGMKIRFLSANIADRFTDFESFSSRHMIPHGYFSLGLMSSDYFTIQPSFGTQVSWGKYPSLEPRLRVAYRPRGDNKQELNLALGRYTQDIDGIMDERDAGTVFTLWKPTEINEPLQSALHGILGYKQRIGNDLTTNIEGYIKDLKKIPVSKWTPEARLNTETAFADGHSYGFDLRLEYDKYPLYLHVGYGWSKVKYEATSGNLGAWIEEPIFSYNPAHDQRHKINTIASYNFSGFTTSINWEFGSGKPYTQVYGFDLALDLPRENPIENSGTARTLFSRPYGERLPVYHRLDFSIERSFEISRRILLQVDAGIINAYDRKNIFYFDLNTLQRVNQTPLLPYITLKTEIN